MCDFVLLQGVGTVVAGTALCGVIHANDVLQLGPDAVGQFLPCTIKSIHRKRMPVTEVHAGQTATFALKKVRRSRARFGFRRTAFKSLSDAPVMCYLSCRGMKLILVHNLLNRHQWQLILAVIYVIKWSIHFDTIHGGWF